MWKMWPKKKISSDFHEFFLGTIKTILRKKSIYPQGKKMLRLFADMPLSANMFPWESPVWKYSGPGGGAPGGGCRGAKAPGKKKSTKKHFFIEHFFFSKVKKNSPKIVRYVPKTIFIEIGRKKYFGYIFTRFLKIIQTFRKKMSYMNLFFVRKYSETYAQ